MQAFAAFDSLNRSDWSNTVVLERSNLFIASKVEEYTLTDGSNAKLVPMLRGSTAREWTASVAQKVSSRLAELTRYTRNLGTKLIAKSQIHHLIADNVWRKSEFLREMLKRGIGNLDAKPNLIELVDARTTQEAERLLKAARKAHPGAEISDVMHSGNHSQYDNLVEFKLESTIEGFENKLQKLRTNFSDQEMMDVIKKLQDELRQMFLKQPDQLPKKANGTLGSIDEPSDDGATA